jgi:hypothetical protein
MLKKNYSEWTRQLQVVFNDVSSDGYVKLGGESIVIFFSPRRHEGRKRILDFRFMILDFVLIP